MSTPAPPGSHVPPGQAGYWAPVPEDPLVPKDLGGWLNRVFEVTKRSFWRICLIWLLYAAALLVPVGGGFAAAVWLLARGATRDPDPLAIGAAAAIVAFAVLFSWVTSAWALRSSIYLAVTDAVGRRDTPRQALRFGRRRLGPLIGWAFLAGVLVTFGFVLLIVPGMYLAVVLGASVVGVVVFERAGLGRCFDLIKNRFWVTFGRLALAMLLVGAYQMAAQVVFSMLLLPVLPFAGPMIGTASSPEVPVAIPLIAVFLGVLVALSMVVWLPLAAFHSALAVVTYAELRAHRQPGLTAAVLAAELTEPPDARPT